MNMAVAVGSLPANCVVNGAKNDALSETAQITTSKQDRSSQGNPLYFADLLFWNAESFRDKIAEKIEHADSPVDLASSDRPAADPQPAIDMFGSFFQFRSTAEIALPLAIESRSGERQALPLAQQISREVLRTFASPGWSGASGVVAGMMLDSPPVVRIQLHPESLGTVEVRLSLRGETISVYVEAQRPEAVEHLKAESDQLVRTLDLGGLRVSSLVIEHQRSEHAMPAGAHTSSGGGIQQNEDMNGSSEDQSRRRRRSDAWAFDEPGQKPTSISRSDEPRFPR